MSFVYSASVGEIAGLVTMSGSIDNRYVAKNRADMGSKTHRMLQKLYSEQDRSEVSVSYTFFSDEIILDISGRIDGILLREDKLIIEEIKSSMRHIEDIEIPVRSHLAQAQIYSYIYLKNQSLHEISLKMTYFSLTDNKTKCFDYTYDEAEISRIVEGYLETFVKLIRQRQKLIEKRDISIKDLSFPFEYRPYQHETVAKVYRSLEKSKNVFLCAPTGSGKSLDALFPSVKLMPKLGGNAKIFCLSAKSTQKTVAYETLKQLIDNGFEGTGVVITAKDKCCRLETPSCNPDDCPYAKDYYDKVNDIIQSEIEKTRLFDQEYILGLSDKYGVCPFELSLDLTNLCDIVICDYNYVFDPFSFLQRYFGPEAKDESHIFLVDEAHNLVDRSRDMYSCVIDKNDILEAKRLLKTNKDKKDEKLVKKVDSTLNRINKSLIEIAKVYTKGNEVLPNFPPSIIEQINSFIDAADKYLQAKEEKDEIYKKVYDLYFDLLRMFNTYYLSSESHYTYFDQDERQLVLFCSDAKMYLKEILKKAKGAVFYSATLTPFDYYVSLLGGDDSDVIINLDSIFPKENFSIAVDTSIDTTYKNRALYYSQIADRIHSVVESKKGNYLVFFPSYAFMESVYSEYEKRYEIDEILLQSRGLKESERTKFLDNFTKDSQITGFVVSGGVFSESVDLTGDRLIGTVICGVSLPMVCTQRELIKRHFDEDGMDGFGYSYVIPAMNKVLQSMGRVIRTKTDTGVAVLLDRRFTYYSYRSCFPRYYSHTVVVNGQSELDMFLEQVKIDF